MSLDMYFWLEDSSCVFNLKMRLIEIKAHWDRVNGDTKSSTEITLNEDLVQFQTYFPPKHT